MMVRYPRALNPRTAQVMTSKPEDRTTMETNTLMTRLANTGKLPKMNQSAGNLVYEMMVFIPSPADCGPSHSNDWDEIGPSPFGNFTQWMGQCLLILCSSGTK